MGWSQILAIAACTISMGAAAMALVGARRPVRVREWLDIVRIVLGVAGVVAVAFFTHVRPVPAAVAIGMTAGVIVGALQGRTVAAQIDGGRVFARRTRVGLLLFGAGIVASQVAAIVSRTGILKITQVVAWFGVGMALGLLLGRSGPVRQARVAARASGVVGALALVALTFTAPAMTAPAHAQSTARCNVGSPAGVTPVPSVSRWQGPATVLCTYTSSGARIAMTAEYACGAAADDLWEGKSRRNAITNTPTEVVRVENSTITVEGQSFTVQEKVFLRPNAQTVVTIVINSNRRTYDAAYKDMGIAMAETNAPGATVGCEIGAGTKGVPTTVAPTTVRPTTTEAATPQTSRQSTSTTPSTPPGTKASTEKVGAAPPPLAGATVGRSRGRTWEGTPIGDGDVSGPEALAAAIATLIALVAIGIIDIAEVQGALDPASADAGQPKVIEPFTPVEPPAPMTPVEPTVAFTPFEPTASARVAPGALDPNQPWPPPPPAVDSYPALSALDRSEPPPVPPGDGDGLGADLVWMATRDRLAGSGGRVLSSAEFVEYLRRLEQQHPGADWRQMTAALHGHEYPHDIDRVIYLPHAVPLFEHPPEIAGWEGVEKSMGASRNQAMQPLFERRANSGLAVTAVTPTHVVAPDGSVIDTAHSYAGLRSDIGRAPGTARTAMRSVNLGVGDKVTAAMGMGSASPRESNGNLAGEWLAAFYSRPQNAHVPLSAAYGEFFESVALVNGRPP